ncbi:putative NBD/HSP70 family sugar kinase [Streptococcus rupicaprae]|uniref:NBD/HSP70 family sugar kinase n=1 Tax=Streptococcus rupicaprae TaxID=759619 RepID=A0ABV2FIW7_9STRE
MTDTHYLSIDVGGTLIKYALMTEAGQLVEQGTRPTPAAEFGEPDGQLAQKLIEFKTILTEIYRSYSGVAGVALSCPGKVDSHDGTVYFGGALPYLHGFNAKGFLQEMTGKPAAVINDGKAAAQAELWQGNLQGVTNGSALILGTGLGGGLILKGQLHQGSHFQAGELSFLNFNDKRFCPEDVAGFKYSPVQMIMKISELLNLEDKKDGVKVFEAINARQEGIWPIFEEFCRHIALVIYNQQAIVDLERVVIGGGISAQPIVVEEIRRQYLAMISSIPFIGDMITPVEIETCRFAGTSNLIGALYQLLEETAYQVD